MVVGTALLTLTLSTLLVGLLTTMVAKFKLATLVQYMPLPVVGAGGRQLPGSCLARDGGAWGGGGARQLSRAPGGTLACTGGSEA